MLQRVVISLLLLTGANSAQAQLADKEEWELQVGCIDKAVGQCTELIRRNPGSARHYDLRGRVYQGKSDHDRALEDFTRAIDLDPKNYSYYASRAGAYHRKRDIERTIADYAKAIELNPVDRSVIISKDVAHLMAVADKRLAHLQRGLAYQMKGDKALAIADFKQALSLAPNDALLKGFLKELGETP
jgi:tetratricopeptide (TPR) repeat protein